MSNAADYLIVTTGSSSGHIPTVELQKEVRRLLAQGYIPIGGITVAAPEPNLGLYQAMYRPATNDEKR